MPKVTFLPLQIVVNGAVGDSILDVALTHDVPLQHSCGGFCACTTCQIVVKSDPSVLTPMQTDESDLLHGVAVNSQSRLGCQAKLGDQDVTVEIVNQE